MKYAIIIPDGCADEPQDALGGRTPLEAAHTPHMDALAQRGIVGRSNNVPDTLTPASDVATLSLIGYDPLKVYTGRAPLEVAAMGIRLGPDDWAIRCNLVTVESGEMRDFTAGHIAPGDGRHLIDAINQRLGSEVLEFHAGVSYRNILVYRATAERPAPFSRETFGQPPHDIPDQPIEMHLPRGPGAELLIELMQQSREVLAGHPVNAARIARGERPATQVWLWGMGKAPSVPPFVEVYGKRGAMLSAVDLVRGVGALAGWTRIDVPGATGYLDTDYAAKGVYGVRALAEHDIVCVHIEAPDEASHEGKVDEKVKALERIDEHIVGPMAEALATYGDWRILITPDHRTTLRTRAHAHGAVPFVVAGTGITADAQSAYSEPQAAASATSFDPGYELMRWFLG